MSDSASSAEKPVKEPADFPGRDVADSDADEREDSRRRGRRRDRREADRVQVNTRLVVGSVLLAAFVAGGAWLLHRYQKQRMSSSLLARANAVVDTDRQKGQRLLREYVKLQPEDIDAKLKLSRLQFGHAKSMAEPGGRASNEAWYRVYLTNEDILRQDGEQDEVRRDQVDVAFRLGRFADVRDHAKRLLEKNDDGPLHLKMAYAFYLEKRYEEAAGEFELALKDPDWQSIQLLGEKDTEITRMMAYATWGRMLDEQLDQPGPAAEKFDLIVKENPRSAEARLLRAGHRHRNGMAGLAVEDAQRATELEPANTEALVAAATLTLNNQRADRTEIERLRAALSRVAKNGTDNRDIYQLLAASEERLGNMDQALEALELGVEQTKEVGQLLLVLATRLADQGKAARDRLQALTDKEDSLEDAESEYLQGCLDRQDGQFLAALDHFHLALELAEPGSEQESASRVQIAKCHIEIGRIDAALVAFEKIRTERPLSPDARLGVAEALVAVGNVPQALQIYRSLPIFDAQTALEVADLEFQMMLRSPDSGKGLDAVKLALDKAEKLEADPLQLAIRRARLEVARGKFDVATEALGAARENWPDRPEPVVGLIGLDLRRNDLEAARTLLDEAMAELGPHPELDVVSLEYWRRADTSNFRSHLADLEEREYPDAPNRWIQLQEAIAREYVAIGDRESLFRVVLNVANRYPDHVMRWFVLIQPGLELGRAEIVAQALEQLRRLEGDEGLFLQTGTAMQLVAMAQSGDKGQLPEARRLLEAAAESVSPYGTTQGVVNALLGQVDVLEGKRKDATDRMLLAVKQGVRSPNILLTTAQLLIEQQRSAEATDILKAAATLPGTGSGERLAPLTAGLLFRLDRQDEALAIARALAEANPDDPSAKILLGLAHATVGNNEEAEREIRAAIELDPSQPGGWVALVDLLTRQGKLSEAETAVVEAEQAMESMVRSLALATCYERVNRVDDAEKMYLDAVESDSQNAALLLQLGGFYLRSGQSEQAETTLRSLLDAPSQYKNADLIAVRRLLAPAIYDRSFTSYKEALRLLETNVEESLDPIVDRRLFARLLVSFAHPDYLQRGLDQFEEIERMASLTPSEHLLVARAYDRLDEPQSAARHWDAVLENEAQPSAIAAYIRRQLKLGDLAGLTHWTEQLQHLAPDVFATMELTSRLDVQNGDLDAALSRLNEYAAATEDGEKSRARQNQAAALLAELARSTRLDDDERTRLREEAKAAYQQLLPDAIVPYATLLARQGEVQQALDELEQVQPAADAVQLAAAGVQVLERCEPDSAAIERVSGWVEASRQADPDSLFAIHVEESLRRMQQQYGEAIELNRTILQQVSDNAVALNNLAWLVSNHEQDHEAALKLIQQAMDIVGPKSFLLDTRGLVYLEMGRFDDAIEDFRASWIQDDLPTTRYHLALALRELGDPKSARQHFEAAINAGLSIHDLEATEAARFLQVSEELALGDHGN